MIGSISIGEAWAPFASLATPIVATKDTLFNCCAESYLSGSAVSGVTEVRGH